MEELRKVRRVAEKGAGTVTETLLVIDATTGQNGLSQARLFADATQVREWCSPNWTARRRVALCLPLKPSWVFL